MVLRPDSIMDEESSNYEWSEETHLKPAFSAGLKQKKHTCLLKTIPSWIYSVVNNLLTLACTVISFIVVFSFVSSQSKGSSELILTPDGFLNVSMASTNINIHNKSDSDISNDTLFIMSPTFAKWMEFVYIPRNLEIGRMDPNGFLTRPKVIYQFSRNPSAGGLGDQLRGMASAFLLAVATDRPFFADFPRAGDISHAFDSSTSNHLGSEKQHWWRLDDLHTVNFLKYRSLNIFMSENGLIFAPSFDSDDFREAERVLEIINSDKTQYHTVVTAGNPDWSFSLPFLGNNIEDRLNEVGLGHESLFRNVTTDCHSMDPSNILSEYSLIKLRELVQFYAKSYFQRSKLLPKLSRSSNGNRWPEERVPMSNKLQSIMYVVKRTNQLTCSDINTVKRELQMGNLNDAALKAALMFEYSKKKSSEDKIVYDWFSNKLGHKLNGSQLSLEELLQLLDDCSQWDYSWRLKGVLVRSLLRRPSELLEKKIDSIFKEPSTNPSPQTLCIQVRVGGIDWSVKEGKTKRSNVSKVRGSFDPVRLNKKQIIDMMEFASKSLYASNDSSFSQALLRVFIMTDRHDVKPFIEERIKISLDLLYPGVKVVFIGTPSKPLHYVKSELSQDQFLDTLLEFHALSDHNYCSWSVVSESGFGLLPLNMQDSIKGALYIRGI